MSYKLLAIACVCMICLVLWGVMGFIISNMADQPFPKETYLGGGLGIIFFIIISIYVITPILEMNPLDDCGGR